MPQQTINIGAAPDDGTGDTLRVGGDKINDNFTELYAADAALGTAAALDVDPDDTLAADSDSLIPTQQAVKAYVDANVGGSVTSLDDVGDVNAPTPANGDVLTWDSTPGEWVAAAPTGGSNALDDLTDVDAPTPADGDVLTFDSGSGDWVPAAPSGGGGAMELISEVVTSGSQSTVTFSAISASYRDLVLVVRGRGTNATSAVDVKLNYNNDTGANYIKQRLRYSGTASAIGQLTGQTAAIIDEIPAASATASYAGYVEARIYDYRGTTFFKVAKALIGAHISTSANSNEIALGSHQWNSASAITEIDVTLSAGNFVDNSVVSLYGVY